MVVIGEQRALLVLHLELSVVEFSGQALATWRWVAKTTGQWSRWSLGPLQCAWAACLEPLLYPVVLETRYEAWADNATLLPPPGTSIKQGGGPGSRCMEVSR